MNKSELLEKIKEKNEELESLNKELKEIIAEENAKNLGKCFKQYLYSGLYIYHKIVQISYDNYKVLTVSGSDIFYTLLVNFRRFRIKSLLCRRI